MAEESARSDASRRASLLRAAEGGDVAEPGGSEAADGADGEDLHGGFVIEEGEDRKSVV